MTQAETIITLADHARASGGESTHEIIVHLEDGQGEVVESRLFGPSDSVEDLTAFTGAFIASMAAEGQACTVSVERSAGRIVFLDTSRG